MIKSRNIILRFGITAILLSWTSAGHGIEGMFARAFAWERHEPKVVAAISQYVADPSAINLGRVEGWLADLPRFGEEYCKPAVVEQLLNKAKVSTSSSFRPFIQGMAQGVFRRVLGPRGQVVLLTTGALAGAAGVAHAAEDSDDVVEKHPGRNASSAGEIEAFAAPQPDLAR